MRLKEVLMKASKLIIQTIASLLILGLMVVISLVIMNAIATIK